MREQLVTREQRIPRGLKDSFAFFADARNLEAITPPWLGFRVITPTPIGMEAGAEIAYRLRLRGVPLRWVTRIEIWEPDRRFVDFQLAGPYRLWHHTHEFEADGPEATIMRDRVRYEIGFGALGSLAAALFVRRDIRSIFDYRAQRIPALLAAWGGHSGEQTPGSRPPAPADGLP